MTHDIGMTDVQVKNHTYSVGAMGTSQALAMLTKLTKIVGEPMAVLMSLAAGDKGAEGVAPDLEARLLGEAVKALTDRLDQHEVVALLKELCETALRDGKKIEFDLDYRRNLGELFLAVKAILGVQYGDFLEEAASLLAAQKATQEKTPAAKSLKNTA